MNTLKNIILSTVLVLPFMVCAGEAININTADKDALMSIKGIGEKRAGAIIMYREQNGPFSSVEQLAEIKGIGEVFIEKNRDRLRVSEPTE